MLLIRFSVTKYHSLTRSMPHEVRGGGRFTSAILREAVLGSYGISVQCSQGGQESLMQFKTLHRSFWTLFQCITGPLAIPTEAGNRSRAGVADSCRMEHYCGIIVPALKALTPAEILGILLEKTQSRSKGPGFPMAGICINNF